MMPPIERKMMKEITIAIEWKKGTFSLETSQTVESRLDELAAPRDENETAESEFLVGLSSKAVRIKRTTRCTEAGTFTFIEPNYSEVMESASNL